MWSVVAPGSLLTSMPNCRGIPRFSHKTNNQLDDKIIIILLLSILPGSLR